MGHKDPDWKTVPYEGRHLCLVKYHTWKVDFV